MRARLHTCLHLAGVLVLCVAPAARADVSLPAILGSNMVWPADRALPFWGQASPGEVVSVTAPGKDGVKVTQRATADGRGRFRLVLPAPPTSSTPFEIVVEGNNRLVLTNVVTGDVWLGSGQSNMEWPLFASEGAEAEIHAVPAAASNLRFFEVRRPRPAELSRESVPLRGRWALAGPDTIARFSAVAYHFGRTVAAERRGRVLGLVHTSWGGSRAEAWVPRAALRGHPRFAAAVKALDAGLTSADHAATAQTLRAWEDRRRPADPGDRGVSLGFARPGVPGPGWRSLPMPGRLEEVVGRPFDGAVWFRTEVSLPTGFRGQPAFLRLGAIDQCDVTYVEGTLVGATCDAPVAPELFPRGYKIPAAATRGGRLTIAVRVWDPGGPGGFLGPPAALRLVSGEGPDGPSLSLAGPGTPPWLWRIEHEREPLPDAGPRPPLPPGFPHYQLPGVLWDNLVAGLAPFPFAGVLWYQGESNTKEAFAYRTLLPTLLAEWRRAFENPRLPFLLVQLAAYHPAWPGAGQRSEEEWAELREAQALVAARDRDTGLVVTLDLGTRDDIHPRNKREVGRRLGLLALAKIYGLPVGASGPEYLHHRVEKGGQVRVRFSHGAGLAVASGAPGNRLLGFELAAADQQFVTADARIEGDAVLLSAPGIEKPVAVRYGWGDDPPCNLTNWTALPAAPFRTDTWPRFSQKRLSRLGRAPTP